MLTISEGNCSKYCDGVARRDFLKIGALGMGGLSLPGLLQAEKAQGKGRSQKAVIMIYLAGGPSHMDTFDLKEDAPAEVRGEFASIPTKAPGVRICEHLPGIAAQMDQCSIIRF